MYRHLLCRNHIFVKGWVTLRANFKLMGYCSRQYLWATMPLDVFTQRNFVADFIRLKLTFIQKTKNRF